MSRSYLFIPGNTPSMIQNLDVFESDAIILDLEDSVLDYDKDAARTLVTEFLKKYQFTDTEIFIRINDSENINFKEDVLQTNTLDIQGYVLPKANIESIDQLRHLTGKEIIPIIESPRSLLELEQIVQKYEIRGILFGAEDFTKELGISRTLEGTEILYTRSRIAITCNAYNIESIDTPYVNAHDEDGIYIDSNNAKNLGFTAKSCIHPNHVDAIKEVFSPNNEEITNALRIIKKAESENKGAFSLDGKMIDVPIIKKAEKVIEKAKKYNLL